MDKLISIFNSFDTTAKIMIIALFLLVILLVVLSIVFALKKDDVEQNVDLDFFDELKKQDNNEKSVFVNDIEKKEEIKQEEKPLATKIENDEKVDIKSISEQMEKDIGKNNIDLTEFELEQEEKAIISYEELIKKVKENELNNVNVQTVDLDDRGYNLENEFTYDTEILDFGDLLNEKDTTNDFTSNNISSVDNVVNKATDMINQTKVKSILDIDEVDDSLYTNNEFLNALKDLRDSLQ